MIGKLTDEQLNALSIKLAKLYDYRYPNGELEIDHVLTLKALDLVFEAVHGQHR